MIIPFTLIEYAALFLIGISIGSFLNVVIYRVPRGESIVFPASHCTHCNQAIKPYQNIPLLSYLFLRGKCALCHVSISAQYPLIEASMGALTMLMLWKFGLSYDLIFYVALCALLLVLSVIDIQTMRLPNPITLTGAIIAVALTLLLKRDHLLPMLYGGVVGIGFLLLNWSIGKLLFKRDGVGMGDIKMAGMIGLFLGPLLTVGMFILSVFVAALIGIFFIVSGKRGKFQKVPFGPYMAAGALVALLWGEQLWLWYARFAGIIRP